MADSSKSGLQVVRLARLPTSQRSCIGLLRRWRSSIRARRRDSGVGRWAPTSTRPIRRNHKPSITAADVLKTRARVDSGKLAGAKAPVSRHRSSLRWRVQTRALAVTNSFGERDQDLVRLLPADACISDALAITKLRRLTRDKFLATCDQKTLEHDPEQPRLSSH